MVRLIVRDDPAQTAIAQREARLGDLHVPLSVTLELEWVLRGALGWPRPDVVEALTLVLELQGVEFEDRDGVAWAVAAYADGADFADMIHVLTVSRAPVAALITFDAKFARNKRVAERLTVTLLR